MSANKLSGSLDTNILLRLVLNDVPAHTRAVEALLQQGKGFRVEDVTIVEMVFVLEKLYRMPRIVVLDNVLAVINHEKVVCAKRVFEMALPLYVAEHRLSFVDCMLLAYARIDKRTPLHTFDKALVKHSSGDAKKVVS
jgi:predicted nucleic-acid-binding protein